MGKKTVTGGLRLKESQEYTRKFGRAVASLFLKHYKQKSHGLLQPMAPPLDMERSRAGAARRLHVSRAPHHTEHAAELCLVLPKLLCHSTVRTY